MAVKGGLSRQNQKRGGRKPYIYLYVKLIASQTKEGEKRKMDMYRNTVTGEVFTVDESREAYEEFEWDFRLEYDSFERDSAAFL